MRPFYYRIYGENQQVISSGSHQMKIKAIPDEYALHHNYPNPFNPTTTILYDVPQEGYVSLVIYDLMGCVVKEIMIQNQFPGQSSITRDGTDQFGAEVGSGIYLYHLIYNGRIMGKNKMILLK